MTRSIEKDSRCITYSYNVKDLSKEEMLGYLESVELAYDAQTNEIVAPTFRHDIFRTADLAEEVARFYGYDNIPVTLPKGGATTGGKSFKMQIEQIAREVARYNGFSQGMSYSFESPKVFDKLSLPEDAPERTAIKISNPLGEDFSIMRTISLNGMLSSLAFNYNHRNKNVRLFELGNIYLPKSLPLTELPDERMQFTLGMYGEGDFFSMKGVVEEFLEHVGITGRKTYDTEQKKPFLHPGRQARILSGDAVLGYLGEVHPRTAAAYGIGEKAYVAVIDMPVVVSMASFDIKYNGIARFPAVTRDISMLVPKSVKAGQIEDLLWQRGGKLLESVDLFDVYEGIQVKPGYKSMAYKLVLRSAERTLEDADINGVMKKVWNGLEHMGIEIRS